jgi:hypothetical protein
MSNIDKICEHTAGQKHSHIRYSFKGEEMLTVAGVCELTAAAMSDFPGLTPDEIQIERSGNTFAPEQGAIGFDVSAVSMLPDDVISHEVYK